MNSRVRQLSDRRRLLQARSAIQRQEIRLDAAQISGRLRTADRAVTVVRRLRVGHWVIAAAVIGIVVFRRHPAVTWAMRGLAVADTARRVGVALHEMGAATAPHAAEGR